MENVYELSCKFYLFIFSSLCLVLCLLSPTHCVTLTHTRRKRERKKWSETNANDKKCDCDLPATQLLHFVLLIFVVAAAAIVRSFVRYHKISFALRHENFELIMNAAMAVHTYLKRLLLDLFSWFRCSGTVVAYHADSICFELELVKWNDKNFWFVKPAHIGSTTIEYTIMSCEYWIWTL